jgi:Zn-dependent protease
VTGRSAVGLGPAGGGIRFELFGFPIRIQLSFFVVAVLLGLFPGATMASVAIWTAVVAASVMCHELGHAFAARRLGAEPYVDLYSFGGLTHWTPPREASRWEMISVAGAGPASGLVLGGLVAAVTVPLGPFEGDNLEFLVIALLWVNVGWSLVNLLPVLPLDGGHILAELLPGTRSQRQRRAAFVSVVFGAAAAAFLISIGYLWGALVFGWAIATNITMLRAPALEQRTLQLESDVQAALAEIVGNHPGAVDKAVTVARELGPRGPHFKAAAVESAAAAGAARVARELLDRLPGQVPPALYALVTVAETGGLQGLDELGEIFHREPDALNGRWMALALHRSGRLDDLVGVVARVPPARRGPDLIDSVAVVASWAGRDAMAAELRSLPVV